MARSPARGAARGPSARRWALAAVLAPLALLLVLGFVFARPDRAPPGAREVASAPEAKVASASRPRPMQPPGKGPPAPRAAAAGLPVTAAPVTTAGGAEAGADPDTLWARRVARAERTLREYREATRYPPTSRPMFEHPDQSDLPAPERTLPLDRTGEDPEGVRVRARQSAVVLAGDEPVQLEVACLSSQGEPYPCAVTDAFAETAEHYGVGRRRPVGFQASADGATWAALFRPSRDGFAGVSGTLRVRARVRAGDLERALFFDLLYTSNPPARFTGAAEDRLEEGSLVFALGLEVARPGRYLLTGRVDSGGGEPFALVTFDGELAAGDAVARLVVFGKLVRDLNPGFPLVLRDVQGFRLLEDADPDRELLPTLAGRVHASRSYPLTAFSDAEWQSEERDRNTAELAADVKRARDGAGDAGGR